MLSDLWRRVFGRGLQAAAEGIGQDNAFGLALYQRLAPSDNFVWSPSSLRDALALCRAATAGATAQELAQVLGDVEHEPLQPPAELVLTAVKGFFVDEAIALRDAFEAELLRRGARVATMPFGAASEESTRAINRWVEEATNGRIQDILAPGSIGVATLVVVVTAAYFKGAWAQPFLQDETGPRAFTLGSGEVVEVATMRQTRTHPVWFGKEVSVLDLGYRGGEMAMSIVVPTGTFGLEAVEATLDADQLARWWSQLRPERIIVELPRFAFARRVDGVVEALRGLGVERVFDRDRADFSAASEQAMFVEEIAHEAYVRVTEEGTEAAAATALAAPHPIPRERRFAADRPFLFFIRDLRDQRILFAGRVADPRRGQPAGSS